MAGSREKKLLLWGLEIYICVIGRSRYQILTLIERYCCWGGFMMRICVVRWSRNVHKWVQVRSCRSTIDLLKIIHNVLERTQHTVYSAICNLHNHQTIIK